MTTLQGAAYLAEALAALSAIMLTRRRAEHRPAAVALLLLAAANILDGPIAAALTPYPVEPWQGAARVLVYLDGALKLASDATIAGLAVAIAVPPAGRRRAVAIVAGVWALASVALAAAYPSPLVRGAGLQRVYLTTGLLGVFIGAVACVVWARALIRVKRSPRSEHAVALALVILDAVLMLTPFSPWQAPSIFDAPYTGVQFVIMVVFAVVAAAQVIAWTLSR